MISLPSFLARLALGSGMAWAAVSFTVAAGPAVTVAPVEQRLLADSDEITGHVEAVETVELRARVSGHLDAVNFQAGQIVKEGDLLFTIDPRWYRAQLDLAKARAEVANREATRAGELLAAEAISNEEAEARRARAAEAVAELATAQLDWEHTQVRAPITGRISRALVTKGNLISGSPGGATLLTTIVSIGEAYVYADIDEATLLKFSSLSHDQSTSFAGGRVSAELELADETGYPRHGYVESSDNRLNPATGSLTLRLVFPTPDARLMPGLFARVRLPIGSPQPRLLISERAIETDQSQKFVLVVGSDHIAAYRMVKLGDTIDGKRVVRDGLRPGDEVIVNGLQRVRPGMAVEPQHALVGPAGVASSTAAVAAR